MKDGDRYRFNLQFTASTQDAEKAGELLEMLGKRKSQFVVTAVIEYLRNHPDYRMDRQLETPRRIYKAELEKMIRAIVDEKLSGSGFPTEKTYDADTTAISDEIDSDIMAMLGNIKLFE